MKEGDHVTPAVKLVSRIGAGAMGSVWVAEHLTLGTQVAVKLMMAHYAKEPEYVERFQREAQLAARIRSPHVVQVLDSGVTDKGVPFILMELLEGETLRGRIDRIGPMPLADVARVVVQSANALGRAHQLGIVHRDVKPENIFLIDVGGEIFVKILDFGIAKQPPAELQAWMTETGRLMGTPFYMSPEQLISAKHVDLRTDVWALAAVAYEALTARRPFQGQSLGAQVLAVHAGGFTRPSVHLPGLPEAIDAWAERALQPDPAARFGSTKELAEAFEAAMRSVALAATLPASPRPEPVIARPPEPIRAPSLIGVSAPSRRAADPTLVSGERPAVPELRVGHGRVRLVLGDIVRAGTEAIVNTTDVHLLGGGALDTAIRAAAGDEVEAELRRHEGCRMGSAVLTGAGQLAPPTRYILHAVGPFYSDRGEQACAALLRRVHAECLRLAEEHEIRSVAFPAISTGHNGYPAARAAPIAFDAAVEHLLDRARSLDLIVFVLRAPAAFMAYAAALASHAATLPGRASG